MERRPPTCRAASQEGQCRLASLRARYLPVTALFQPLAGRKAGWSRFPPGTCSSDVRLDASWGFAKTPDSRGRNLFVDLGP